MKDEVISFETAKLAKEKGFDVKTRFNYVWDKIENRLDQFIWHWKLKDRGHEVEESYDIYPKPTQSLLQRWLREKHDVVVIASYHRTEEFIYFIGSIEDDIQRSIDGKKSYNPINKKLHKTYEKALEEGLYEALKLI